MHENVTSTNAFDIRNNFAIDCNLYWYHANKC